MRCPTGDSAHRREQYDVEDVGTVLTGGGGGTVEVEVTDLRQQHAGQLQCRPTGASRLVSRLPITTRLTGPPLR